MDTEIFNANLPPSAIAGRIAEFFDEKQQNLVRHTDRLFARLMVCQWIGGIAAAAILSPRAWTGTHSQIHLHLFAAVVLGGIITAFPVFLALRHSGQAFTRHAVAVGQMLMSGLLIHLTGGRIETHFHVFGSLAILAFYRDWRVLISATAVVFVDHLWRGFFWPESVYGVLAAPVWRSFEHAGWVVFEVTFLIISIRKSRGEMMNVAERQARLEAMKESIEATVEQRTEQLRRSEEQLRQAQKMEAVGRLAGGVAHDFNNLLTVITGFSALALQRIKPGDSLRKNFDEIQHAAERAASLTGQLLAFSRKQVLKPRVLNLNTVLTGMEKMLRRLIGEDIELTTTFAAELGNVKADPGQIEQVVLNLAVNARDAMPRGGKLTLKTANVTLDQTTRFRGREMELGEYVLLAISDTGVGMTEEVKAHLFEPFFTTKGVGRGTGLGLATCYGIVSQSDGDIRVYSEPNCGTTFKVYLPRVDAQSAPVPAVPQEEFLPPGTESILVVEDEAAVRRLTTTVLRDRGYQVQEARDGAEALAFFGRGARFDLVLTDVIMPKMSGKELNDQLKSLAPRTKVLFMSGYTDDALASHGVLESELLFIEKPFSPSRLARKVRETIDLPAPGQPKTELEFKL
jgi:signal transduction histidine kinase/CheY-like chemotaxis protein